MFLLNCFLVFLLGLHDAISISDKQPLHFELRRRGSRFVHHEPANLTALNQFLDHIEERYTRTYRKAEDNRLVRQWLPKQEEDVMLNEAGLDGSWYIVMEVGEPAQLLEVTVDMLSPDWYHIMTSSGKGSKYDTFMSSSHISGNKQVHALCHLSSDTFHLSKADTKTTLDWPICQSSHSSLHTLHESGTILGLAPNNKNHRSSLSRINDPSLLNQLHSKSIISDPIWSITILDSTTGILTLGGTIAKEMEEAKVRTDLELKYFDQPDIAPEQIEDEVTGALNLLGSDIEEQFKWIDVHGSEGWWTGLISGIWINGVKILKNQPFLLDLSIPIILAPPSAFQHFYTSIPGSRPPPTHNSTFHTYPCLNPPSISFELGGWIFPLINEATRQDSIFGPAGGEFSLGKINDLRDWSGKMDMNESLVNSGYCVGGVVMSKVGEVSHTSSTNGNGNGNGYRSGMKDVWVLGEMFFRGMGIVFDDGSEGEKGKGNGKARVGFRKY